MRLSMTICRLCNGYVLFGDPRTTRSFLCPCHDGGCAEISGDNQAMFEKVHSAYTLCNMGVSSSSFLTVGESPRDDIEMHLGWSLRYFQRCVLRQSKSQSTRAVCWCTYAGNELGMEWQVRTQIIRFCHQMADEVEQ